MRRLQSLETVVIRIAIDLRIFNTLVEHKESPTSLEKLVESTGAERILLSRLAAFCYCHGLTRTCSSAFANSRCCRSYQEGRPQPFRAYQRLSDIHGPLAERWM